MEPALQPLFRIFARAAAATCLVAILFPDDACGQIDKKITTAISTPKDQAATIAGLLAKARQSRTVGHLVAPPGNNAAEFYAQVLRLDPRNAEAKEELGKLRETIDSSLLTARKKADSIEVRRLESIERSVAGSGFGERGPASGPPPPSPVPVHPAPPIPVPTPPVQPPPRLPAAIENDVDKLIKGLPTGNIAFNVPDAMHVGQTQLVHVVLSGSAVADELRKKITEQGAVETDRLKISDDLEIHLTGAAFKIEPVTPERQVVGTAHTSEWQWQVTPTDSGSQELELTVSAVFRIDGEDRQMSIVTFDRKIDVQVDWSSSIADFFQDNWQWLWTAILVPVGIFLYRRVGGATKSKKRCR